MSIAVALDALTNPISGSVTVVGEDSAMQRRVRRVLDHAGFDLSVERALLQDAREFPPERVVVLATTATDAERVGAVKSIAADLPHTRILAVMPTEARSALLRRTLLAGARAVVLEADIERALAVSARAVLAGQLVVPERLGRQIAPTPLSHREKQIIGCVVRGLTNREIARELYLAESTVKTHLSSAFRKLDARSRAEAVARIQDPESGYGMGILELS